MSAHIRDGAKAEAWDVLMDMWDANPDDLNGGDVVEQIGELRARLGYSEERLIPRESIVEALRDAHRNDSAADAVEFVSDLIGWCAEWDPVLRAEGVEA